MKSGTALFVIAAGSLLAMPDVALAGTKAESAVRVRSPAKLLGSFAGPPGRNVHGNGGGVGVGKPDRGRHWGWNQGQHKGWDRGPDKSRGV